MLRDPIMHDAGLSSGIHRRLSSVRLCYELNFTETPELESLTRSPVEEPGEKQRELWNGRGWTWKRFCRLMNLDTA